MNLVSVDSLSKSLGDKVLFNKISFGIEEGDKLALIGNNGTGKTTLLRMLAGKDLADSGTIATNNTLAISYLEQIPEFTPGEIILDHILKDDSPLMSLIREYEACLEKMNRDPSEKNQKELSRLIERMDKEEAWLIESEIKSVLSELGITDPLQPMDTLSGGMLKKVAMARALVRQSNLLFLDEPTNHLDIKTICWLEEYLIKTKKAVILVTHDRYFLDKVCNHILEIDEQNLWRYDGNYTYYLEKKAEREYSKSREQERLQTILKREVEWLRQGAKARTGKSKARKDRIVNLMDQRESKSQADAEFSVGHRRLGKKILELKQIEKSYGEQKVINPFSYSFKNGERIGLIGPNGSGKTTFLKLITGRLGPDQGMIDIGINTHFGFFDQMNEALDENRTILEFVRDKAEYMELDKGATLEAERLLERFGFPRPRFNTQIQYLSGGEKRRLYLIQVLMLSPNFLIFDEPTNDFDIKTLSLLEDFLSDFPGCFAVVSHDRYFLDRTIDFLFIFDGDGNIYGFGGNYSQYLEFKTEEEQEEKKEQGKKESTKVRSNSEKRKLSFKEQKEFEALEKEIAGLEKEQEELDALFASGEDLGEKVKEAQIRYDEIIKLLDSKMSRWAELAEWME